MIETRLIKILRDCARGKKTLAETSALLHRPEMEVLNECWALVGFREFLPGDTLTTEQKEEFFNRCRPKIGRLFIAQERDVSDIDNRPIFSQPTSKKQIRLSRRMPDPYLRPAIQKPQVPTGINKLLLERDRIIKFREAHPKVVFKKQDYCYKTCEIGRTLRYNEHCTNSAGIYTYAGENYIACMRFEEV